MRAALTLTLTLTLTLAQNAGGGLARRASVAHLAWEEPHALRMAPASLDLIVGSDLIYGGLGLGLGLGLRL